MVQDSLSRLRRPRLLTVLRVGLATLLLILSAAMVYIAAQSSRAVEMQATRALHLARALTLSSSIEDVLRTDRDAAGEALREIISDPAVASAYIAEEDGEVTFHTDPGMIGSHLPQNGKQMWPTEKMSGRWIRLASGVPAYEFNYIIRRSDGKPQWLNLILDTTPADRILPGAPRIWWTVGGILVLLCIVGIMLERVVTHQLRLQEELERRNQLALIGQMTAVLAHEIRNVLGSTKGYIQWVEEKLGKEDSRKGGLSLALQGVRRIETLVNDLLRFSREETYKLEPIDTARLIQDTIDSLARSWEGKVVLAAKPRTWVMGDEEKLRRVLLNGIHNAIQATNGSGNLRISVYPDRRWVRIRIKDNGPGIPQEEARRLFTPFHTTKTDGTGLGLAYSKKAIEGMGGRINLVNRKGGRGAVLTIELARTGGG